MKKVHCTQNCINSSQASGSEEHQGFSSKSVNSEHPYKCEYKVDASCDYDIKQNIGNAVASIGKDLLCIVKYYIYSAPLLENCKHNTQYQQF